MASANLDGTARFTYTHPDNGATTHLLGVPLSPLREIRPVRKKRRYDWSPVGMRDREIVTVGEGVEEVTATIRVDNDPVGLMEMLHLGLEQDLELTYQRSAGGEEFPVHVMALPGQDADEVGVIGDRGRYGGGEWEVRVVLRRRDGGSLAGMFTEVSS